MSSDKTCRICHSCEDNKDLFSPCLCRGSMVYVHRSCLKVWIASSGRKECEVCGQQWKSNLTKIIDFIEKYALIYIIIHTIILFMAIIIVCLIVIFYDCEIKLNKHLTNECHSILTSFSIFLSIGVLYTGIGVILSIIYVYGLSKK